MAVAERDHPTETLLLDRAHEALRIGIRIGYLKRHLHYTDPGLAQPIAYGGAPLRVAVTDQQAMPDQRPVIGGRQRAYYLAHEPIIGKRGRAEDLYATRGQVDREDRVVRHQAAPRPDLRREEICARDRAPVRPQERLPRRRPLGCGWYPVRLQNPRDRRPTDPMAHVLQRAGDPGVAPRGVLLGHPYHQAPDLGQHAGTTASPLRVRPFARDQLPMPPQNRVGRDDRRDLTEAATAQPVSVPRQPTAFLIGQAAPAAHVPAEDAVFFDEVGHRPLLPLVEPADQRSQEHSEEQRVEHGERVYTTRPDLRASKPLSQIGRAHV